jgi:hypothetical protein
LGLVYVFRSAALGVVFVTTISPALADDDLRGFIEARGAVADGEETWLEGGFGKTRSGEGDDDAVADGVLRGMLEWRPQITWGLNGYVTLQLDTQMQPAIDIGEAFVSYRGAPSAGWRLEGRAGLFYPPISLEHDGIGWTTTYTITPSAINSWVGEEVRVFGVEATARRRFDTQEFEATLAAFGFNDGAGTLLAFRGWALGDVTPGLSGELAVPWRSFPYQEHTSITYESDNRIGYYAQVRYRPVGNVSLDLMYYDNRGDRISDVDGQTNWETQFLNVGARIAIDEDTHLLAQAMSGRTVWGMQTPMGPWTEVDFNSGYVLLAREFGRHEVAGRLDYFQVDDQTFADVDNNDEEGWAATAAYQFDVTPDVRLAIEGLLVSSERPARLDQGIDPEQDQSVLQTSVKFSF